MSRAPGTRIGSYEVVSAIGAGSMGEVYRARDPRLGRDVAIKVLPSVDIELKARFALEARAFASLSQGSVMTPYADEQPTASAESDSTRSTSGGARSPVAHAWDARIQSILDIEALLSRRLWFFALLIGAFYTLLLPGTLKTFSDSESARSLRVYEGFKCVVLLTAAGLFYILHRRRSLTLSQLRAIELVLFGLVLLQFAWVDYRTLFVRKLPSAIAAGRADEFALIVVGAQLLTWFVLIVSYGILIPNAWRRCALVVGIMASIPVALTATAGLIGDGIPRQMSGRYLAALCTWLGMIVAVAVYGSHRIEVLRQEAYTVRRLGNYRLKERLGAGGMGEVYLAEHAFLRRPCAVKLIRPDRARDSASLARFEREVQMTSTLTHPNTVQIYDYGHADDGTFYYVMEFLPGLTLQQLVEREGPLSAGRTIRILRQLCGALREAHAAGLIHCDVKPGNTIICDRGGEHDVAKLLDFGLVRSLGWRQDAGRFTERGVIQGTPAFMSPEQALGGDLDSRTDIYSLGAVAYFLQTGEAPFAGSSAEVRLAHICDTVGFPERAKLTVPHDLQAIILRCLEKDPARRFQSADTLNVALAECRADDLTADTRPRTEAGLST
jgi:eukaryotic-like serine/threonine-protein kinase